MESARDDQGPESYRPAAADGCRPADSASFLFLVEGPAMTVSSSRSGRIRMPARPLRVEGLEAREVPATALYATGAGAGGGPHVIVRNAADQVVAQFMAFETTFAGGV